MLRVGEIAIEEVDLPSLPSDDVVRLNAFENVLEAEAHPDDPPTPLELTRAQVRNVPDVIRVRAFWAREADGSIAGTARTSFRDTEDNRHLLDVSMDVHPDRRRRGIGRVLLGCVAEVAEVEGRPLLVGVTSDRVPDGEAFARRLDATRGIAFHTNRLVLDEVDRDLVDRWIADGPARAPGYELVPVDGRYPDELLEAIVDVHHVMNTAPRDDLDMEDFRLTPDQVRQYEESLFASGTERWSLFARHGATGELVGLTEVFWNPHRPETVHQGDTGVAPEHRGHGLGKWLKGTMLRRILQERPGADDVRTGNADSNDAMLGINRAMGFRPYEASIGWQLPLERVRAYLEG